MSDELKPCPFCGGEAKKGSLSGDEQNWMIWCRDCGIPSSEMGVSGETFEDMTEAWNTRTALQSRAKLRAKIEALRRVMPKCDVAQAIREMNIHNAALDAVLELMESEDE